MVDSSLPSQSISSGPHVGSFATSEDIVADAPEEPPSSDLHPRQHNINKEARNRLQIPQSKAPASDGSNFTLVHGRSRAASASTEKPDLILPSPTSTDNDTIVQDFGAPPSRVSTRESDLFDDFSGASQRGHEAATEHPNPHPKPFIVVDTFKESTTVNDPHTLDAEIVAQYLETDFHHGLSSAVAQERLGQYGPNSIESGSGVPAWKILVKQVSNSLTLVLIAAMCLSYGTKDYIEGSVIAAVIMLNICVGFWQDYSAEQTMQSLKDLSAPEASVVRDGKPDARIQAKLLVPGDIVYIKMGDKIPADIRLFETQACEIEECSLTGESIPVNKRAHLVFEDADITLGDRKNMAYMSTSVVRGKAKGIVVKTGMETVVGQVAGESIRNKNRDLEGEKSNNWFVQQCRLFAHGLKKILGLVGTPLQVKLSKFALWLFALAILLAIIVFSANKWHLSNETLIYGICVAVAVIPESLIAVLTITMAMASKSMGEKNVRVRKMECLEAVGGVTNICSDKTGTLTQGKMLVRKAVLAGNFGTVSVSETKTTFDPQDGIIKHHTRESILTVKSDDSAFRNENWRLFLRSVALNNDASVVRDVSESYSSEKPPSKAWTVKGDPTEISLRVFGMRFGYDRVPLQDAGWQLVHVHPFDSTVKRMSSVFNDTKTGVVHAFVKGAAETVVERLAISEGSKEQLKLDINAIASEGLRVIVLAHKIVSDPSIAEDRDLVESNLEFLGYVGIYDPPRQETAAAVAECQQAGIEVHMLTGDHVATARAIAREIGILDGTEGIGSVMLAADFDKIPDSQLDTMPTLPKVIGRCTPQTKVKMVDALRRRKAFCVMTGDGVNDAVALTRADVGIAMGTGSDVAKDAADLVLTDDNFASIVSAIREGRRLFDNIQKFLMHLLVSNIAQVILLLIALAFRDSSGLAVFPLSPVSILWANMVTSSFLALGLGMEEAQLDIMHRPPRALSQGVFTWELITDKMIYGSWMGLLCLVSFISVVFGGAKGNLGVDCNKEWAASCEPAYEGRATVFAVLTFLLLITALEVKHFARSLFRFDPRDKSPFSIFRTIYKNHFLFWAVVAGFVIAFPVIYIPWVNHKMFKHSGMSGWEWGLVAGCCIVYVAAMEGWKATKRHFKLWSGDFTVYGVDEADVEKGRKGSQSEGTTRTNTLVGSDTEEEV